MNTNDIFTLYKINMHIIVYKNISYVYSYTHIKIYCETQNSSTYLSLVINQQRLIVEHYFQYIRSSYHLRLGIYILYSNYHLIHVQLWELQTHMIIKQQVILIWLPILGFAFIASVVSSVNVALKILVTCSAPLTKAWLVDGEVYNKYSSYV